MTQDQVTSTVKKMLMDDIKSLEAAEQYHLRKLEEVQSELKSIRNSLEKLKEVVHP